MSSVTLMHSALVIGCNEVPFKRDTCVVINNTIRQQPWSLHGKQDLGCRNPQFAAMLPIAKLLVARRRLRSTSSSLTVRRTRLSTVGDRAFAVAAAPTWNSLPQHVTSAPSVPVFRGRLKAFLFRRSFPWLVTSTFVVPVQWLSSFSDT